MALIELWVRLEDEEVPSMYTLDAGMADLTDLAPRICEVEFTPPIQPGHLQFFRGYSKSAETGATSAPLPVDIRLIHLKTSAEAPLIVRFPFSAVPLHIRFHLSGLEGSVTLPHSTGSYCLLRQRVYTEFELLRDGDPEFFFFHQGNDGEDGDNITKELELNAIVEEAPTTSRGKEITLSVKVLERKAYRDYTITEVSRLFVRDGWNSIINSPRFEPASLSVLFPRPHAEYESFVNQLKDRNRAFGQSTRNLATAHQFISVFIVTAIRLLQDQYWGGLQNLQLLAEEPLNGTCGYGLVNYLIKYF